MSSALTKSGVAGSTGPSAPFNLTCTAPAADARLVQYVAQPDTFPEGVAHRAVAPLAARDARVEEPAAVARALADRRDFDGLEILLQVGNAQAERLLDQPMDLDAERRAVSTLVGMPARCQRTKKASLGVNAPSCVAAATR